MPPPFSRNSADQQTIPSRLTFQSSSPAPELSIPASPPSSIGQYRSPPAGDRPFSEGGHGGNNVHISLAPTSAPTVGLSSRATHPPSLLSPFLPPRRWNTDQGDACHFLLRFGPLTVVTCSVAHLCWTWVPHGSTSLAAVQLPFCLFRAVYLSPR